uniref:AlNc14C106G6233 protein n=1 Tax=Albugo laibachii Nc14 TaxID=890382 RepID=F0WI26_9STRA|nr:AlNc14C106G6233 [Albugo laibachii Nc14]|eukprot:CCA20904.1 AlNc14C106G6233 [Albugo laibachii Nc14]
MRLPASGEPLDGLSFTLPALTSFIYFESARINIRIPSPHFLQAACIWTSDGCQCLFYFLKYFQITWTSTLYIMLWILIRGAVLLPVV